METLIKENLTVLNHPLVKHNLAILRDKNTNTEAFRLALKRISYALFFEASKDLPTEVIEVETPITKTKEVVIKKDLDVIVAPILRAGLVFSDIAQELLPFCKIHHLGMYRNETTLDVVWYYNKMKGQIKDPNNVRLFILDPMLATGNSSYDAIKNFIEQGIKEENIVFMSLISAPEGVQKLTNSYKKIKIITAGLDEALNSKGYIVPGLGDAGDRIFNTV